ncbi:hypothetical protein PA25_34820 [Pseudoalteromonas sp. A25]|uniref:hypothetical protein n=1 Tax=Pseudoalteromonas sp. A25 TaxID=116092 RepID=UPI0012A27AE8|nr:hypothetical protein [Pseudoalteromonas sp. A25]BBN83497.1 hypothetical protein PA25_34820 [Pseudoalteromonas sp. A25]
MKTSIKLNIKAKKLKELSKDKAKLVGGGALTTKEPQQQGSHYWSTYVTCINC